MIGFDTTANCAYRCTRCGICLEVCPTFIASGDESLSARGRISLAEALLEGRIGFTDGLADRLSRCLGCLACADICPSGVDPPLVFQSVKTRPSAGNNGHGLARFASRRMTAAGGRLTPALRLAISAGGALGGAAARNLFCRRQGWLRAAAALKRAPALPEVSLAHNAARRVAFFPGCATNLFFPQSGRDAITLINDTGADVITPEVLACCGLPLLSLGDAKAAREAALSNFRVLGSLEVDAIVTTCPTCAYALKLEMPRLLGKDQQDVNRVSDLVMDIHEYLVKNGAGNRRFSPVASRSEPGSQEKQLSVTWHDPCHLRFGLHVTAEPREIISGISGVEYVETGSGVVCCGGGGIFSLLHRDLALKIGRRRAENIALSGVDIVATGCPACRLQLDEALAAIGAPVRVMHTVELLAGRYGAKKLAISRQEERCRTT